MSRAIKLKNNDYLDSTGIVHNKKILKDVLGIVLFDNDAGVTGEITLDDNISDYEYLDIYYTETWSDNYFIQRVNTHNSTFQLCCNVTRSGYNGFMSMAKCYVYNENRKIIPNQYATWLGIYFSYYKTSYEWHSDYNFKIKKIIGYK